MKTIPNMEAIPGTFAFYNHKGDQILYGAEFDTLSGALDEAKRLASHGGGKVYVVRISRVVAAEVEA